jgi:hypothetical protein
MVVVEGLWVDQSVKAHKHINLTYQAMIGETWAWVGYFRVVSAI